MSAFLIDRVEKIKFTPTNRYLLIMLIAEEDESVSPVLLPTDYSRKKPITEVEIVRMSDDCKISLDEGDKILVETHMIREIEIDDVCMHLVLENHVLGKYSYE
jgi:co-chaperonin GroES (HSP10)